MTSVQAFPAHTRCIRRTVNDIITEATAISFADKIMIMISQAGKLSHWIHVPLANSSSNPMDPGPLLTMDSENSLLPMTHLTATTVLGGTRRDDEVLGQTLATTIASAVLTKRPSEERLLIVGLGLEKGAETMAGRAEFEELIGIVLDVL
jgi:proteasome assembly chaperone 3